MDIRHKAGKIIQTSASSSEKTGETRAEVSNLELNGWICKWRNIALYLDHSVKTVQRWYYHCGLPVRKAPSGHVCLCPEEASAWLKWYDQVYRLKKAHKLHCVNLSCMTLKKLSNDLALTLL